MGELWIDFGSAIRGIRAMTKDHDHVNFKIDFDMKHWGRWCHIWTPIWHEGRGPYITIGLGPFRLMRGY
jgi:hypothetical protein